MGRGNLAMSPAGEVWEAFTNDGSADSQGCAPYLRRIYVGRLRPNPYYICVDEFMDTHCATGFRENHDPEMVFSPDGSIMAVTYPHADELGHRRTVIATHGPFQPSSDWNYLFADNVVGKDNDQVQPAIAAVSAGTLNPEGDVAVTWYQLGGNRFRTGAQRSAVTYDWLIQPPFLFVHTPAFATGPEFAQAIETVPNGPLEYQGVAHVSDPTQGGLWISVWTGRDPADSLGLMNLPFRPWRYRWQ
jgi:hypothetical protein